MQQNACLRTRDKASAVRGKVRYETSYFLWVPMRLIADLATT